VEPIADYELVRSLGAGNHGEFFLARPPARLGASDEFVAVKVLAGPTTEDTFRRATRELKAFARVQSPYLVRLLDAGQDGERFFYAISYFPLGSLAAPARPLERVETLQAVGDAARAADALHEAGIAHRGIKPGNILLTEEGGQLTDLGLAQVLQPGATVTGIGPVGSVEYLDPAILNGEQASRATDIWSLGVTLHRALAGVGVYGELPDNDPLLAIRRVLSTEPALSDRLSAAERELIESALATDPALRPATAAAFAEQVDALAAAG
jgi:eukaryotic-like serine/threonine-protein kinase